MTFDLIWCNAIKSLNLIFLKVKKFLSFPCFAVDCDLLSSSQYELNWYFHMHNFTIMNYNKVSNTVYKIVYISVHTVIYSQVLNMIKSQIYFFNEVLCQKKPTSPTIQNFSENQDLMIS